MGLESEFKQSVLLQVEFGLDFMDRHWKDLRKALPSADLEAFYNQLTTCKPALKNLKLAIEEIGKLPPDAPKSEKIEELKLLNEAQYSSKLMRYRQMLKDDNYPDFYADDERKVSGLLRRNAGDEEALIAEARRMAQSIQTVWKAFLRGNAARSKGREDIAAIFFIRGLALADSNGGRLE